MLLWVCMLSGSLPPVFKKLNFKHHSTVFILSAPASFHPAIDDLAPFAEVRTTLTRAGDVSFALCFATQLKEVEAFATRIAQASTSDAVIWVAYPKQSSRTYKCEFNRDNGWGRFGELGYEPVRQIAIDEDWSALRFRRVEHIQTMVRSFAMTEEGKRKSRLGGQ